MATCRALADIYLPAGIYVEAGNTFTAPPGWTSPNIDPLDTDAATAMWNLGPQVPEGTDAPLRLGGHWATKPISPPLTYWYRAPNWSRQSPNYLLKGYENFGSRNANAALTAAPYVGPGDLVTGGWQGFWGFRAFSAATTGSRAIRVQRDHDGVQTDIATLANGNLDTDYLTAFKGSDRLTITKIYDQTLNPQIADVSPDVGAANIPLSPVNGKWMLDNSGGRPCCYKTIGPANFAGNQYWWNDHSWSMYGVWNSYDNQNYQNTICDLGGGDGVAVQPGGANTADQWGLASDSFGGWRSAAHGQFHAGAATINQQNAIVSLVMVDTPSNFVLVNNSNAGEGGPGTAVVAIWGLTGGTFQLKGYGAEVGWAGPLPSDRIWSQNEAAALIANARAYWGF